jgi:hypothetical protein
MRTVKTVATVSEDGTLTLKVPPDILAGEHQVVLVIAEKPAKKEKLPLLGFPVIHVSEWPVDLSLRREDMYGDWGR